MKIPPCVFVVAILLTSVAAVAQVAPTCGGIGQLPCPVVAPSAFSDALNVVLAAAATSIAGIIVAAGVRLRAKWGVETTAQDKANLEADIAIAMKAGIAQVLPVIEQHGWNSPEAREAIITTATGYLKQRFPDRAKTIAASGTPAVASPDAAIAQTLAARLPEAAAVAAASPATPPIADPPKAA